MTSSDSIAHRHELNFVGQEFFPDGLVPWREARPPTLTGRPDEQNSGQLRSCRYCGSMHPADVAAAIRAGARGAWADWKYGWPHKAYFNDIPNPYAGMLESRSFRSHPPAEEDAHQWRQVQRGFNPQTGAPEYWWAEVGQPAGPTTYGKFYTIHLLDAAPEDRMVIEQHLGLRFVFLEGGRKVQWSPIQAES